MGKSSDEQYSPAPNRPPCWQPEEFVWGTVIGLLLAVCLIVAISVAVGHYWYRYTGYRLLLPVWWSLKAGVKPGVYPFEWTVAGHSAATIMGVSGLFFGWVLSRPPAAETHARGRQLSASAKQADRELVQARKRIGEGINVHPKVRLSLDQETKHIFVGGATGGGKTVFLLQLIEEIQRRGDRLILYDDKPDFIRKIKGTLIVPWDSRGVAWAVGYDCRDKGDADSLAARLIDASSDPMWSEGARNILAAAIVSLQQAIPLKWTFLDLVSLLSDGQALQAALAENNPLAAQLLADLTSKTAQSFLTVVSAYGRPLISLAEAWNGKKQWSARRYLLDSQSPEARLKTVIISGNKRYKPLAQACNQSLIAMLTSIICSPEMPDDPERRIWIVLDELPQLGKVEEVEQLLAVGRSKGVRIVVGVQDISQLREIYSTHSAQTWASLFGTWIIAQPKGLESPKWFSQLLGEREVWRYNPSAQRSAAIGPDSISDSWQLQTIPVVPPDTLTDTLGPDQNGVRIIYYRPGSKSVYRLTWPYRDYSPIRDLYKPFQPLPIRKLLDVKNSQERDLKLQTTGNEMNEAEQSQIPVEEVALKGITEPENVENVAEQETRKTEKRVIVLQKPKVQGTLEKGDDEWM